MVHLIETFDTFGHHLFQKAMKDNIDLHHIMNKLKKQIPNHS